MPSEPADPLIPPRLRQLCRLEDLPDNDARSFPPTQGRFTSVFAVRQGETVRVYVNACPHIGTPLDWVPNRFLSADRTRIVCATHGAEFRIDNGLCTTGPCQGDSLQSVLTQVKDGWVLIPETAGV